MRKIESSVHKYGGKKHKLLDRLLRRFYNSAYTVVMHIFIRRA